MSKQLTPPPPNLKKILKNLFSDLYIFNTWFRRLFRYRVMIIMLEKKSKLRIYQRFPQPGFRDTEISKLEFVATVQFLSLQKLEYFLNNKIKMFVYSFPNYLIFYFHIISFIFSILSNFIWKNGKRNIKELIHRMFLMQRKL